jgi:flavin-dependent dehydrogenase
MRWLATGPLVFSGIAREDSPQVYTAGDSASFVDPFTGSGILNALLTGRMAGSAAAGRLTPRAYSTACHAMLHRPFEVATAFRAIVRWGFAEYLAPLVPGRWLYRLTRA